MTDTPKEPEDLKLGPPRKLGMHPDLFASYAAQRDAHTPSKLSEEVREMRIALREASRDDPLVRHVLNQAEYIGLNGEDTYTMLAFHLYKAYAQFRTVLAADVQRQFRIENPEIAKFFADKADTNERG